MAEPDAAPRRRSKPARIARSAVCSSEIVGFRSSLALTLRRQPSLCWGDAPTAWEIEDPAAGWLEM